MSENHSNKMGTMPVGKLLFNMALPITISMLFQALYNIVDSYFVAQLNQDAMNAVSLSFPMQSLLIGFAIGTGVGMSALISRALGERKPERANEIAGTGIFLYFCLAVLFSVIGFTLVRWYFSIQTKNENIIRYGTQYLTTVMGVSVFLFFQVCFERLLQSTGRSDKSMISQLSGAVVNMILDPLFIYGIWIFPRLEVWGAAVATVIGQCVAMTIGLTLNIRCNKDLTLSFKQIRFRSRIFKDIYAIGLPSILMQTIGSFTNFFMNRILIGFTEAATAVYGAYFKLQSFFFMPVFGLNNGMVPIVSYNYGAARLDRVKETYKLSVITAVSIMLVGFALFMGIPHVLIGIFKPSEEMLAIGVRALRIICLHFLFAGFCIISGSMCQAIGNPMHSLIISIFRQVVGLLPSAYLLSLTGDLDMVWFCFPIAEVFSLVFSIIFLRKTMKNAEARIGASAQQG
ncbi:MAG: MATE family efflux transporter [Lachnospiraceae bacterium]|nr:MATE family efflux transporter [Lachnospiraceae bacterium]